MKDWHCNWLSLGATCRFCFHDIAAARRADKIAREEGGRVIMCQTHYVPPEGHDFGTVINNDLYLRSNEIIPMDYTYLKEEPSSNLAAIPFIGDIKRGDICIFIPGYFEFFHETRIAVSTISTFMPGVRVAIATHPMDYRVFYRWV